MSEDGEADLAQDGNFNSFLEEGSQGEFGDEGS
jgi:hypothetical protein